MSEVSRFDCCASAGNEMRAQTPSTPLHATTGFRDRLEGKLLMPLRSTALILLCWRTCIDEKNKTTSKSQYKPGNTGTPPL